MPMQSRTRFSGRQSGFSLIAVSLLLSAAAIVMVSVLPGQRPGESNMKVRSTIEKLERVEKSVTSFMALNGRRPSPADGQYDINNANFGKEAATPGTCTVTAG